MDVWEQSIEVTTGFSMVRAGRPHEIHQHARDRLAGDPNDFDRVDAIMALRRAVGQRVRMLNDIYQLRELPIGTKPRGDLELLSCFGIVRPFMLRRLIDIRNIVEYQDSSPPPVEECLMFADLVWYFLRSTDEVIRLQVETILYGTPGIDVYGHDSHSATKTITSSTKTSATITQNTHPMRSRASARTHSSRPSTGHRTACHERRPEAHEGEPKPEDRSVS
jgi:hypothetical protein